MARTYQPAKEIALELRKLLAKTVNGTNHAVGHSPAEQSDKSPCQISPYGDACASEAQEFTAKMHRNFGHDEACGARNTSSRGEWTLPAAFTAGDEVEMTEATASMYGDRHFLWPPYCATRDNDSLPNDMSSEDHLRLALFYEPQLRDFAYF